MSHPDTPRPMTDYQAEPVACPQCGQHRPPGYTDTTCVPCANTGHLYRLMGAAELVWCARRDLAMGYREVSERRLAISETLGVRS